MDAIFDDPKLTEQANFVMSCSEGFGCCPRVASRSTSWLCPETVTAAVRSDISMQQLEGLLTLCWRTDAWKATVIQNGSNYAWSSHNALQDPGH